MKLLTPDEVSERLGIPKTTLADWRYRGKGPDYCKVGRHVRYRDADLRDYIEGTLQTV